ncbi:MAG: hypothetical protein OEY97_11345 [Nitrospirota bacterium]|nr:hypothetical protein [Nitrospirota bacterium]
MMGRRATWGLGAAVLALVAGWLTLLGVGHLEQDNAFCNRCHVDGAPLHTRQFLQVTQGSGTALAAAHRVHVRMDGEFRPMRCVDCHTGVGAAAKARFHWIAFRDLMIYLSGQGHEPDRLTHPMPDVNCTRCHGRLRGEFHTIRAHQGDMKTRCTECHRAHADGPGPAHTDPQHSVTLCARCHAGLADGVLHLAGTRPEGDNAAANTGKSYK